MHNRRGCEISTLEGQEESLPLLLLVMLFSVFCFSLFGKRHWSKPLNQTEQGPGAGPAGGLVVPGFQGSFHDKQQLDPSSWIDCCTAVYLYCTYFETNHLKLACFYTILSVYCVMRVCVRACECMVCYAWHFKWKIWHGRILQRWQLPRPIKQLNLETYRPVMLLGLMIVSAMWLQAYHLII